MKRSERSAGFVREMWHWFPRHRRNLPWRDLKVKDDTQRAYMVLVSEVMLQQTQVPRVEIIFKRFLRSFPTLHALARASNRDVILAWRGMGYNSRALRLRDAARCIVDRFQVTKLQVTGYSSSKAKPETRKPATCNFPKSLEQLTAIPGIGPYTGAAILNFAFNIPAPCIDTNIRRILHRVFFGPEKKDGTFAKGDKALLKVARGVLEVALHPLYPPGPLSPSLRQGYGRQAGEKGGGTRNAAEWHAALMDFGSLVCTKRSPQCSVCPLAKNNVCKSVGRCGRRDVPPGRLRKEIPPGRLIKKEPGRAIAGTFVPNRIIRGRIVEFLRDEPSGAGFNDIGANVCIDWNRKEHADWLRQILGKLEGEGMISCGGTRYSLAIA